jgi:colicin import membrane protein
MKFPRLKSGVTVSTIAHAAVLLWALVSFAAKPFEVAPAESMPVDIISSTEFSQLVAGSKTAPKKEAPKPLVEKIADPKPVDNVAAKVSDKPEIVTASTAAAAPPEAKLPEPKAKPQESKREAAKQPEAKEPEKKEPEKIDPVAEALKKDERKEPKKETKQEEAKPVPTPPRKPEPKPQVAEKPPQQEQSKFNANQIAALLDKREPRRLAAAGDTLNTAPSLGARTTNAPTLSQSEIDALRARIQECWNPPAGAADARDLAVLVRIQFNQDGSLAGEPRLITRVSAGYQQIAAESAIRAVRRCAPYTFMPAAKYESWKDVEVNFDPRDLFRG